MTHSIAKFQAPAADNPVLEGFDSLIAPLSGADFFADYWETRPFFIKRARPGYFDALLSLENIDHFIGTRLFREQDIRIAKQGKIRDFADFAKDGAADRNALLDEFGRGATLVFEHLNRHHEPLAGLIHRCEADLHVPLRANVYLTPNKAQGFARHWDTHDVLILQVHGKKTWQIFDNPLELPAEEQKSETIWTEKAQLIEELTLEPGDVLFLPRGFVHSASTSTETSLHITVGIRSLSLRDVARRAFDKASLQDVRLRRVALFDKFQREENLDEVRRTLHELVDRLDLRAALDEVYCSYIRSRFPPLKGRLLAMSQGAPAAGIDHQSRLRVRHDCLFQTFDAREHVKLAMDGKVIKFPKGVEDAFDFIRSRDDFAPQELPGLEYDSRLILSERLLREGLLEPA